MFLGYLSERPTVRGDNGSNNNNNNNNNKQAYAGQIE
jgi:hypothetical protein